MHEQRGRRIPSVPLLCAVGLLLAAAVTAVTVESFVYSDASFAAYRTWAWSEGSPAAGAELEARIREDVERQLQRKGWVPAAAGETADLLVKSEILHHRGFDMAVLRVDVIDAASEKLLWRGLATELFSSHGRREKIIDRAVKQMFRRFPAKEEG